MKHRLQMSADFKKKVTKFLMRNPHLSLEGLVSCGIDHSRKFLAQPSIELGPMAVSDLEKRAITTFFNSHMEVLPSEYDTKENRGLLHEYIARVKKKLRGSK